MKTIMVTMLREARGERQGERGSIKGTVGTKVGSNLPQKIFVAPKVFKNC